MANGARRGLHDGRGVATLEERESQEYYDRLGPWATGRVVLDALGIKTYGTLRRYRRANKILGVQFQGGRFFYPVQQFKDGQIVEGLEAVLAALSVGFAEPEAQAGWLGEEAYEGRPESRWDVLRAGHVETVVLWAEEDATALTR
jgi:hypothetical protein